MDNRNKYPEALPPPEVMRRPITEAEIAGQTLALDARANRRKGDEAFRAFIKNTPESSIAFYAAALTRESDADERDPKEN